MEEELSTSIMTEIMRDNDTSYESSDCDLDESKDDTSNDDASEEGFESDDGFESNANYSSKENNNNNIEVVISLPEEKLTTSEENEDTVIATARRHFLAKFQPANCESNWFQKQWGTVLAIECIEPIVGNHVKKSFAAQKDIV